MDAHVIGWLQVRTQRGVRWAAVCTSPYGPEDRGPQVVMSTVSEHHGGPCQSKCGVWRWCIGWRVCALVVAYSSRQARRPPGPCLHAENCNPAADAPRGAQLASASGAHATRREGLQARACRHAAGTSPPAGPQRSTPIAARALPISGCRLLSLARQPAVCSSAVTATAPPAAAAPRVCLLRLLP